MKAQKKKNFTFDDCKIQRQKFIENVRLQAHERAVKFAQFRTLYQKKS